MQKETNFETPERFENVLIIRFFGSKQTNEKPIVVCFLVFIIDLRHLPFNY